MAEKGPQKEDATAAKRVLLISKKNSNGALYRRALEAAELEVECVDTLVDVEELLAERPAKVLVHALEGFERNQTTQFHFRFCATPIAAQMHRFMIYRGTNMRAVAFSLDLGMQKAISQERAAHTLGYAVRMCLEAGQNRDALQEQGLGIATSGRRELTPDEINLVEKVFRAFPNDPLIRVAQARILAARGEYSVAVELSRRTLLAEPYNVRAMTVLGEIEAKVGQLDLALKLLKKAEELSGGNPERLAALADVSVQLGLYSDAKNYLLTGLRLFPESTPLRREMVKIPLEAAEFKEVLELMVGSLSGDDLAVFAGDASKPLVLMQKYAVLLDFVNVGVELLPEKSHKCAFLLKVAQELKDMGAKTEAVAQLRRCLTLDPKFPGAGDLLIKIQTNLAA
ncbi:MAG: tetratricopeptide repeat protein [Betaproteobacteria bacterium]|nr:tetratricopeptide repeat protein [Betaproteobacteria bacterium]